MILKWIILCRWNLIEARQNNAKVLQITILLCLPNNYRKMDLISDDYNVPNTAWLILRICIKYLIKISICKSIFHFANLFYLLLQLRGIKIVHNQARRVAHAITQIAKLNRRMTRMGFVLWKYLCSGTCIFCIDICFKTLKIRRKMRKNI